MVFETPVSYLSVVDMLTVKMIFASAATVDYFVFMKMYVMSPKFIYIVTYCTNKYMIDTLKLHV